MRLLLVRLAPVVMLVVWSLASRLSSEESWDEGYCPVCGGPAAMGTIREGGDRQLHCGFC